MLKNIVYCGLVLFSLNALSGLAFSSDQMVGENLKSSGEGQELDIKSRLEVAPIVVTGQVRFEQRFTVVTDAQCGRAPCVRSQSYWSLVIQSGESRYILNRKLNQGDARAPEFVEIAGVPLRPGSVVKVEAQAVASTPRLYILTEIKKVDLLMDLGWACHTAKESDPNVYVRLWYDSRQRTEGAFKIRVQQFEGSAIYQIAYIDRAVFIAQQKGFAFTGSSPSVEVELAIQNDGGLAPMKQFPAMLKVVDKGQSNQGNAFHSPIAVNCSQTRFSPRSF